MSRLTISPPHFCAFYSVRRVAWCCVPYALDPTPFRPYALNPYAPKPNTSVQFKATSGNPRASPPEASQGSLDQTPQWNPPRFVTGAQLGPRAAPRRSRAALNRFCLPFPSHLFVQASAPADEDRTQVMFVCVCMYRCTYNIQYSRPVGSERYPKGATHIGGYCFPQTSKPQQTKFHPEQHWSTHTPPTKNGGDREESAPPQRAKPRFYRSVPLVERDRVLDGTGI